MMRMQEQRTISVKEVDALVKEYTLLGSKEVRKEAMEYMHFLQEEVAMVLQESGSGEEQEA